MALFFSNSWQSPAIRGAGFGLASIMLGLAGASPARAALLETLSTTSTYSYDFTPQFLGSHSGVGDTGIFNAVGADPSLATDIKINYATITTNNASFFFLHNIQCKGYCSVSVETYVVDTITNTGTTAATLRLDSNITAGHLGFVRNGNTQSAGVFQFDVTQKTSGLETSLYQAKGKVSTAGATIDTSDGSVFNNLVSYTDSSQIGLDWDETDLSVLLNTLAPGETTTVTYRSQTYLTSNGVCTDVVRCIGIQVAFGDPRNNGGVIGFADPLPQFAQAKQPLGYVLDRGFDMATVKFKVVGTSDVPEPAIWAMMLSGFALTGVEARRRRARTAAAG